MSYFYSKAAAGGSFPAADLLDLRCNDGSGSTVTATTGPNATKEAGVTWSTTGGGTSLDFPGGVDTEYLTTNSNITWGTVTTIAYWAHTDTDSVFIQSNPTLNASYSWNIYVDSGQPRVTLVGGAFGTRLEQNFTSAATGAWHHYAVVIDMAVDTGSFFGSVKVYVDGSEQSLGAAEVDAKDDATGTTAGALRAGVWTNGRLDDIRAWSTALTSGEISALYAAGRQ
jgi:hypothetical protein